MSSTDVISHEELVCDSCGYPRRGLEAGTLCPECGALPPVVVRAAGDDGKVVTAGEMAHLRRVACGLALLIIASFAALRVSLVMPLEMWSLPAVNVPGVKVHIASMLQRSVGNQPGPWGVAGVVAALGVVAGVWLVTERRTDHGPAPLLPMAARWVALLGVGGVLGLLLSGVAVEATGMSTLNRGGRLVLGAALLCEIPANLLLCLHLRALARSVGDKRAEGLLRPCAWVVPGLTAGALAALGLFMVMPAGARDTLARNVTVKGAAACYGAVAVPAGIAMTFGGLRLFLTTAGTGFGPWFRRGRAVAARLPEMARRVMAWLDGDVQRWAVVTGLVMWVLLIPGNLGTAVGIAPQWRLRVFSPQQLASPIGPRMPVSLLGGWRPESARNEMEAAGCLLLNLVAIWLVTVAPGDGRRSALRFAARWLATLAAGVALGMVLAMPLAQPGRGVAEWRPSLHALAGFEAAATVAVYLYLAQLAGSVGRRLRWRILALGICMGALSLGPYVDIIWGPRANSYTQELGDYYERNMTRHPLTPLTRGELILSATWSAAGLAAGLGAAANVLRLAWGMGRKVPSSELRVPSLPEVTLSS